MSITKYTKNGWIVPFSSGVPTYFNKFKYLKTVSEHITFTVMAL